MNISSVFRSKGYDLILKWSGKLVELSINCHQGARPLQSYMETYELAGITPGELMWRKSFRTKQSLILQKLRHAYFKKQEY